MTDRATLPASRHSSWGTAGTASRAPWPRSSSSGGLQGHGAYRALPKLRAAQEARRAVRPKAGGPARRRTLEKAWHHLREPGSPPMAVNGQKRGRQSREARPGKHPGCPPPEAP